MNFPFDINVDPVNHDSRPDPAEYEYEEEED